MKAVRETLANIDGVDQVRINFGQKTATVTMADGTEFPEQVAATALKDRGGFTLDGVTPAAAP